MHLFCLERKKTPRINLRFQCKRKGLNKGIHKTMKHIHTDTHHHKCAISLARSRDQLTSRSGQPHVGTLGVEVQGELKQTTHDSCSSVAVLPVQTEKRAWIY